MSILGGVEKIHNNLNTYTTEDIKVFKFSTSEWGAIINDDDYSLLEPIRDWRALGKTPIIEIPDNVLRMSGGRSIGFVYLPLIVVSQSSEYTILAFETIGENVVVSATMACQGTNVINFNTHTTNLPIISGNTVDGELLTTDGDELITSGISVSDLEDVIASIDDVNTKTFYLSGTSDLTNAQAAYDWYKAGKTPIIRISGWNYSFILEGNNSEPTYHLGFYGVNGGTNDGISNSSIGINPRLELRYSSDTVTSVVVSGDNANVLFTDVNYSTPYTPQYNGSPATKKYVDDSVNWIEVNVNTADSTAAKVGTTAAGNYTPTKGDFLLVNFVNGSRVSSPTLNVDGSGAINIKTGYANANLNTLTLGSTADSNIKILLYYDGTYYKTRSTTNDNYSSMTQSEAEAGTVTTARVISAKELKKTIKYHAVSDTAYDSTWDGVTDIAPSKNAVYDKIESLSSSMPSSSATAPSNPTEGQIWYDTTNDVLKVYDGTNWNAVDTNTTYNAGEGIEIGTYNDYSAMRGPCPKGFHVPTNSELQNIINIGNALSAWSTPAQCESILNLTNHDKINWQGGYIIGLNGAFIWSCTPNNSGQSYAFSTAANQIGIRSSENRNNGYQIRPFKDKPVAPDNTRTTLVDGSSVATGAGIFSNPLLGLISLSGDGINWTTIAIKNLGAPDTTSAGYYYQWGNNNGFVANGYTTSETTVDASNYGPLNYYNSNVFIMGNSGVWDSSNNRNLRGGVTGVVTLNNAISNTGVLSVNGQTGDVAIPTPEESNTKTFYLSSTSDLTTAQAAYDWYLAGKNPIIVYNDYVCVLNGVSSSSITFSRLSISGTPSSQGYTQDYINGYRFNLSSGTVTSIGNVSSSAGSKYLALDYNYATPYTPQYNGSPATKKYVDDTVASAKSSGATAPSNPVEGQLWYDTTNDVLKVYNGTAWVEVGGGITNDTTGTTSTISQEWVGTKAEFNALSSYGNKIYNIIE